MKIDYLLMESYSFVCETDLHQPMLRKSCTDFVLRKIEEINDEKNRSPDISGDYNLSSNQDQFQFRIFIFLSVNSELLPGPTTEFILYKNFYLAHS